MEKSSLANAKITLRTEQTAFKQNNGCYYYSDGRKEPVESATLWECDESNEWIEWAFFIGKDKVSYAVFFVSVCMAIFPKAPGKALDMHYFFKSAWSHPTVSADGTIVMPAFKERALEMMNHVKANSKTEPRLKFIDSVHSFIEEMGPNLQKIFKLNILHADLQAFEEFIVKQNEQIFKNRAKIEECQKAIDTANESINSMERDIDLFIANQTDEDKEFLNNARIFKRARTQ